jgi:hypothetical protein
MHSVPNAGAPPPFLFDFFLLQLKKKSRTLEQSWMQTGRADGEFQATRY